MIVADAFTELAAEVRNARHTFNQLYDVDPDTFYLTPAEAEVMHRAMWDARIVQAYARERYRRWVPGGPRLMLNGLLGTVVDLIPGRVAHLGLQ